MIKKIIDTISVSYDDMPTLLERQSIIEDKLTTIIKEKAIADSFESKIEVAKNGRCHLTIDLLSLSED